jgi:hypothetical protein
VNGLQDILRPILLAVSCHILNDVPLDKGYAVLKYVLGGLDGQVVVLTPFLSLRRLHSAVLFTLPTGLVLRMSRIMTWRVPLYVLP